MCDNAVTDKHMFDNHFNIQQQQQIKPQIKPNVILTNIIYVVILTTEPSSSVSSSLLE